MNGPAYTKSNEGSEAKRYTDTKGKISVGVGFNMDAPGARETFIAAVSGVDFDDVYNGKVELTDTQIDALYAITYARAEAAADRQVVGFQGLADEVKAVVVDMVFNLGEQGFAQFKRVRDALRRGDRNSAADCMADSLWFKQVPNRAHTSVAIMRSADKRSADEAALAQKWIATA